MATAKEKNPVVEQKEDVNTKKKTTKKPKAEKPIVSKGVVTGCQKLNVRESPRETAKVIGVLPGGSVVEIDMQNSSSVFYKVKTEKGLEGFCMKKFVQLAN